MSSQELESLVCEAQYLVFIQRAAGEFQSRGEVTGSELQLRGPSVAVMIRHIHGQGWMQTGLVTMCKKCVGCVDMLVTMLQPVMCTEWRLTYKNQLLKAQ